jgi:hypothetical protein
MAQEVLAFERFRPLFVILMLAVPPLFLLAGPWLPPSVARVHQGRCEQLFPGIDAYQRLKQAGDRVLTEPEIGSCTLSRYPQQRVFVDTRFDFYGQQFTETGRNLLSLVGDWQTPMARWHINTVILSRRWPLVNMLALLPQYHKHYEDDTVVIYRLHPPIN